MVTTPVAKALSHSIIVSISSVGVVSLSICVPKVPPKVRKTQGGKKTKFPMWLPDRKRLRAQPPVII